MNMYKYLLPTLIYLLLSNPLTAQYVTIYGHVKGFDKGSMVRVIIDSDPFSKLEHTLATTYSDEQGNFTLHFPLKHITYAQLAINLKRGGLFLKPGVVYRVEAIKDTANQDGSIFDQQPLEINLLNENLSFNNNLGSFNELYNKFILSHFRDIYLYHNVSILQNFKKEIKEKFSNETSAYLRNYIQYSLASLDRVARTKSVKAFARAYFVGHPVLYYNVQYAYLFTNFFGSYFESTLQNPVNMSELSKIVPLENITRLDGLFSEDALLKTDPRVRELAEMVILRKYYFNTNFHKRDILALLKQIARRSRFQENRRVAHNFLIKLQQLMPDSPAPDFRLPDFMGKEYSLGGFKGKFVLLSFYKIHCPLCVEQLSFLKTAKDRLENNFTPVVVIVGKNPVSYLKAFSSQKYHWPFLLLGKDILMLEKYQVKTYPAYVLINPNGSIAMAPAPMPGENALKRISLYISQYEKRD